MSETKTIVPGITQLIKPVNKNGNESFDSFSKYYDSNDEAEAKRKEDCTDVANMFYNLVTDFYEYGWGQGFHFGPLRVGESFEHSMARYQYSLALKLGLKPGMEVFDVGCGVGGPARGIASFSGSNVVGLNINKYQLERCAFLTKNAGLGHLCTFVEGDFNDMPFKDNTFDAALSVESTCYSVDKKVFGEIYRTLKPGAKYALYEWVMTEKFDPSNKNHVQIKNGILLGNGLPDLQTPKEVLASLRKAGFKILEAQDIANSGTRPWYYSLQGRWTLSEFKTTPLGMELTNWMVRLLEYVKLAPEGSYKVSTMLSQVAKDLVNAGKEGIFSPSYMVVVKKPAN